MKEILEKLECLEEVNQQLVRKLEILERKEIRLPELTIPDYNPQLRAIKEQLSKPNFEHETSRMRAQMNRLERMLENFPQQIPVRHTHHLNIKSARVLLIPVILFMLIALLTGVSISLWKENRAMIDTDWKYRLIRQFYPQETAWAEEAYQAEPDAIRDTIIKLEKQRRQISEAEQVAREKEQEAEKAREELKRLRREK